MSNGRMFAVIALMGSIAIGSFWAQADESSVAAKEMVEFRLEKWRTTHAEAGNQGEIMQKLRCEVNVASHGGHLDVNFRCPKWQQLALNSHDEAHQWEAWFKKHGFETKHAH